MRNKILQFSFAFLLLTGGMFFIKTVNASSFNLYTPSGFIDFLIEKGIIPESKADKARELFSLAENINTSENESEKTLNSDKVEVSVNQLIQYANLKYEAYTDIEGLLLLVKNISDEDIFLEAKRGCAVTYEIYDDENNLVYNSADEEKCQTDEKVRYLLRKGKTRMFQINHKKEDKSLSRGVYDIKIKYSGYGEGVKRITVE